MTHALPTDSTRAVPRPRSRGDAPHFAVGNRKEQKLPRPAKNSIKMSDMAVISTMSAGCWHPVSGRLRDGPGQSATLFAYTKVWRRTLRTELHSKQTAPCNRQCFNMSNSGFSMNESTQEPSEFGIRDSYTGAEAAFDPLLEAAPKAPSGRATS